MYFYPKVVHVAGYYFEKRAMFHCFNYFRGLLFGVIVFFSYLCRLEN